MKWNVFQFLCVQMEYLFQCYEFDNDVEVKDLQNINEKLNYFCRKKNARTLTENAYKYSEIGKYFMIYTLE